MAPENQELSPEEMREAQKLEQELVDQDANKKAVKVAAKTAAEVYAPGVGGKVVDIAAQTNVGNKILETGGNVVSKINKTMPFGGVVQDQISKASETGVLDAADSAVDMLGGDVSDSVTGAVDAGSKLDEATKAAPDAQEKTKTFLDSTPSEVEDSSDVSLKRLKIFSPKYLIIGGFVALFFLFFVLAVGSLADLVLDLTDGETPIYAATSPNSMLSDAHIEKNLIYVGDSRIVGIKNTLSNGEITYLAEEGAGYHWYIETALTQLEALIGADTSKYVVLSFGINDLSNIDEYIKIYNTLINKYQNVKIYLMSVNPVDESLAAENGYNLSNAEIAVFNNLLKISFPDNFIDVYTLIKDNFKTTDGVHYDEETNQKIHQHVIDFIKRDNPISSFEDFPKISDTTSNMMLNTGVTLVQKIGTSGINDLNAYIDSMVGAYERCSPEAVAAAGYALVYGLYNKGVVLPYYWDGHQRDGKVNANWGETITTDQFGNSHKSFDCGGFTDWAIARAGVNVLAARDHYYQINRGKALSYEEAYVGTLLASTGHIALIVDIKDDYLITAESTTGGVQFKEISKRAIVNTTSSQNSNQKEFTIVDTRSYYQKYCN